MRRLTMFVLGFVMILGTGVGAVGVASAAPSTRINLTLTCDREIDGKVHVALLIHHAGGLAGDADLDCGPDSLSGSRSVKNPQYPSFSPTGITITEFRIYPSGALEPSWTCIPQADGPVFYDLAAKVRCEDPTTHVGATLVAR